MSSKKNNNWAVHADFSPYRYKFVETTHILIKNSKNNPVVFNSVLDSNCKRFGDTAKWEGFNQKPEIQMTKTHFNNWGRYIYQNKEVKEKL